MHTILFSALPLALAPLMASPGPAQDPCNATTLGAFRSCRAEAVSNLFLQRAKCSNLPSTAEQSACNRDAMHEFLDALELCDDQRDARVEVCGRLGGGLYHPSIDPHDFVRVIDNPFFPLSPDTTFIYETETADGTERVEFEVTDQTRRILGVTCTEIHDVVTLEGEFVEDTLDWFAQDRAGNVWYFGELAMNFEDGRLANLDGSWLAGQEGASPGMVMKANPRLGDFYRQEFLLQVAEDVAGVQSLTENVVVPFGSFPCCLQTEEFTPLEPGHTELKYYARGIGQVLTINPVNGERTQLVAIVVDHD